MADVTDFLVNGGLLIIGGIIAFIITGRYQKHKDGRETRNKMIGRCTELGHKIAVIYELFREYHATFNNNQNNRAELKSKIMGVAIDYYALRSDLWTKFFLYYQLKGERERLVKAFDMLHEYRTTIHDYIKTDTAPESFDEITKLQNKANEALRDVYYIALFYKLK